MKHWKVLAFTALAGVAAFYAGDITYAAVGDYPNTFGDIVITTASTTDSAGLRVPHGTAPTSPTNGDVWTTTGGLYARINGSTQGPYVTSSTGISGPGSSTDNAIMRWNGAGGAAAQNSGVTIDDTGLLLTDASDASSSGFRLPHGAAPTSPVNGDVWTTTAGLYFRINGTTYGPVGSGTGDVTAGAVMVDNTLVRGDGGAKGVQDTGVTVDDSDNVSIPGTLASDGASQTFGDGSGVQAVYVDGGAGTFRSVILETGGVRRAEYGIDNTAEGGSDAGSLFYVAVYDDSGVALGDNSIEIDRVAGDAEFPYGVQLGSVTRTAWRNTIYWFPGQGGFPLTDTDSDMEAAITADGTPYIDFTNNDELVYFVPIPSDFDGSVETIQLTWMIPVATEAVTWSISCTVLADSAADSTAEASPVAFDGATPDAADDHDIITVASSSILGTSSNAGKNCRVIVKCADVAGANKPRLIGVVMEY